MHVRFWLTLLCTAASLSMGFRLQTGEAKKAETDQSVLGNEACSSCHSEIYKSYRSTVMARASGPAPDGFVPGEFDHRVSRVHFRVFQRDGRVWMSYNRPGDLAGEREFIYFIGSGKKGRTYLFSDEGYLFEAPINWYTQENRWNMTPAYTEAREIPMSLPAFSSCLNCHTSRMQPSIAGTPNKFTGKPFLHDGITCERCHGSGNEHVNGKGAIVNPAKLPAERRDAICMECHFEGTVAIEQPGKRVHQFQPGDKLSDYVHYFLLKDNQPQPAEALSQFEALSLSVCKRESGDRMWCGSCHDPHIEPKPEEKAAYFRNKCLQCHGDAFAAKHHPGKPDCVGCHMPALPSKDVAHTQSTDHRILKRASTISLNDALPRPPRLESFPKAADSLVTNRDRGLAWEMLADRGVGTAAAEGERYLRAALKEVPDDPTLLSTFAFVEQQHGKTTEAQDLYRRALKLEPDDTTASTNLGILEARSGNLQHAIQLWQEEFLRVPYRSEIGMDLAIAFCTAGQKKEARHYLERVLQFNPDSASARRLLANLNSDPVKCSP
jgi:predicted CXXCH cytochrome family protein